MMKTLLVFVLLTIAITARGQHTSMKKYTRTSTGYLMVLHQGDSIITELESFATQEKIGAANFTSMGFVDVTFGFFNAQTKKYMPQDFKGVELASMHGSIAWKDREPSIHAHGVVGDKSFKAYAGHILSAVVGTGSVEIVILVHDKTLQRKRDEKLGADILQLE